MITRAFILKSDLVLMVKEYVERGDIVWNFPGGKIENGESPEEACIREVREETGFEVTIKKLLLNDGKKITFQAEVTCGKKGINRNLEGNDEVLDVEWVSIFELDKWDGYTLPILQLYKRIGE